MTIQTSTILVVDDNLKNIQLGINILKEIKSYTLIFASSGKQALERLREQEFDLILLDIIMPEMDGYEVCRLMKSDPDMQNIPVIFLTAKTEHEDIIKGFETGGVDYITKPFNPPELLARVKTQLTLRHAYKKELLEKEKQLLHSQKMESIGILSSGLAHNFNNILTVVITMANLIEKQLHAYKPDLDQLKEKISIISDSGHKASGIIKSLMTIASGDEKEFSTIDIRKSVQDIVSLFRFTCHKSILISENYQNEPAIIHGNASQIEQALLNMMINAQHAMTIMESCQDKKGGQLTVALYLDVQEDGSRYWVLSVKDTGVGMSQNQIKTIFSPFHTTKKENSGTGLGLAVSEKNIKSHNGYISVRSVVGEGSTFSIYLPAVNQ